MDASEVVDKLFVGVVPEREDELRSLWGRTQDRFRIMEQETFLLQQVFGTIQISDTALDQIWICGAAATAAFETFQVPLQSACQHGIPPDIEALKQDEHFRKQYAIFSQLFDFITSIETTGTRDPDTWPAGAMPPHDGIRITTDIEQAMFDMCCMSGAYVFAHEIRHVLYVRAGDPPDELLEEERECDRWALALMVDEVGAYAAKTGETASAVRAKRLLAVMIAKMLIAVITPRSEWNAPNGHPSIHERLHKVLEAAGDALPEWFWNAGAAMLLGFAYRLGIPLDGLPLGTSPRSLAYAICDRMR